MFDALFFNKEYLYYINGERRNKDKENVSERTRNPLIPDIKVNYAIYEAEVVTFEQAKTAARKKGLNKAINDSNKLSILLHDQITLKNYINLINLILDEPYDSFKGIIRLNSLDSKLANPDTSWIVNIKE
nr:7790_t:CDS:2 [Entrophospora candida]